MRSFSASIGGLGRMVGAAFRTTNLFVAVAVVVVMGSAIFADQQNSTLQEQQLRSQVTRQVSVIRTRLEGNINGNLQLVRGLVATLVTEPGMGQTRFARLASQVLTQESQLRSIAGAPDLKVTMTYPLKGNEKAIGLDYTKNDAQREAAYRARDTGKLILAGPVQLVQGGIGFIGRFPVFLGDDHSKTFWGIVSAVVDADKLYLDSGLLDRDLGLNIALRGPDGTGSQGDVFFGSDTVLLDRPVSAEVKLPGGSWQILGIPAGGWAAALPSPWGFRALVVLASLLVLVPLFVARVLIGERHRNIRTLREREHQLDVLSRRLGLALDTSEVGVFEYNIDTDTLVWDDRMNDLYGQPRNGEPRNYQHWKTVLHPDDVGRAQQEFTEAVRARGRYHSEFRLLMSDGRERVIRAIGTCFRETDGSSRVVGVNWDVSADVATKQALERAMALTEARNVELVQATERIEHTSLHDALTHLPTRRYLDRVLQERAAACDSEGGLALLHIDLDRFKQINDTLGHAAGDAMLVHTAKVLRDNVRADDFVARIGGDEFVVLSALRNGRRDLARLARRIVDDMRKPMPYDGHECRCGVSIGVAYQRGPKVDDKRLLIDADIALYRAKRRGRNRHEFFTEA
ncbi:MAG: diguanylate cyclase, partial [Devosia sp.]